VADDLEEDEEAEAGVEAMEMGVPGEGARSTAGGGLMSCGRCMDTKG
jgi:hypothetical protein